MAKYSDYIELHEEANAALECPKSSELTERIDRIGKILDGMDLEWYDAVRNNFDGFKSSLINHLRNISGSITSNLSTAENIYKELKDILDKWKNDNDTYIKKKSISVPKYVQISSGKYDSNGEEIFEYIENEKYIQLEREKAELERKFSEYTIDVSAKQQELLEINRDIVKFDSQSSSISTSAPEFEMPEYDSKTSNLSDDEIFTSDGSREGNAFDIWKFFVSKVDENGNRLFSDAAIAGILGNMETENSNFDPDVYEGSSQKNKRAKGYGLIQWTNYQGMEGGRRDQLFSAANQAGTTTDSLQFQCEYLWDEVFTPRENAQYDHSGNTDYYRKLEAAGFFETDDPVVAARLFHNIVEASADSEAKVSGKRGGNAQKWYNEFSSVSI